VYPHIGDLTNLAGYPSLKPNIIFCDYLLDHNLSLRMDHQFKEDRWCQDRRFEVSFRRKSISGTYLISITFLPEDEQTSKHGGGGRYNAILEFKGEQIKNFEKEKNEKKERKKKKRKNMSMYDIKIK
jgi:MOSC domain-containing protein YiiM